MWWTELQSRLYVDQYLGFEYVGDMFVQCFLYMFRFATEVNLEEWDLKVGLVAWCQGVWEQVRGSGKVQEGL